MHAGLRAVIVADMTRYLVYDVFTDRAFAGNPLAVIPNAGGLDPDLFQSIAREFNFSETTFVLGAEDKDHDARVRIFTPVVELPFAGHPTIGTAIALNEEGLAGPRMTLELGVGPLPVTIRDGVARFVTRVPLEVTAAPDAAMLADCALLDVGDIETARHAPVTASVGVPFVLAELASPEALSRAAPDPSAFRAADPEPSRLSLLLYVRDGSRMAMRMFAPLSGIPEDPATGSAAAALAAFIGRLDGHSLKFEMTQGVDMGRPSSIGAEVEVENGQPVAVAISGRARRVMEGRLVI